MLGRAAITLGIDPHSSFFFYCFCSLSSENSWPDNLKCRSEGCHIQVLVLLTTYLHNNKHDQLTCLIMAALCNRAGHYIFVLWFLLSSSSFFLA